MGDDDETRLPRAVEREHQFENPFGGLPVEISGRLVGQHAGRLGDQCARDRRPLPFATRQFGRRVLQAVSKADLTQHHRGARFRLGFRQPPDEQRHGDVLERAELGQQMVKLIHETEVAVAQDPALRVVDRRQIVPHQLDAATARGIESAQQVQQRALARTRRTDDRHPFGDLDFEIDPQQNRDVGVALAENLAQALAGQYRLTHSARPPPD